MKELEYPFDPALIISKRKQLRRLLLADGTPRIQKRIAVLGGSTTSDIVKTLELFLLDAGIEPEFYESEYGQYYEDAMFPGEKLLAFRPDLVWIHTSNRNVTAYPEAADPAEEVEGKLRRELEKFQSVWESVREKFHCPIIQNNFEMPLYRLFGNRDAWDVHGGTCFLSRLNEGFASYAREHEDFYLNDLNYVSADYGLREWSNPLYWNMYKYAMCFEAIPAFAFNVARIVKSLFGKNKKVLALDLDNTLWGGVVGDDGVEGIEVGQETGVSQSFFEFQSYCKRLRSLGILLTVCSKNDPENALAGLNHPEGALRPGDFTLIKANWENKDRNILETAAELSLLPDSIVFADDNPAEREIVRCQVPGAAVPPMEGVENYIATLDRGGYFEVTAFSEDDLKRNEMYQKNAARAAEMASFADYGEYLKSLDMRAVIDDFLPVYLARITQLTNKSNQFNLTTRRYTQAEMESVFQDPDTIRLYGKLADKFGDNGVVSVVVGRKQGETLDLELWLMSCRVLKRDLELAMLDRLIQRCREAGLRTVTGHYYPTRKNGMVRDFFGILGFEKIREDEEGNTDWRLDVEAYEEKRPPIRVFTNETWTE